MNQEIIKKICFLKCPLAFDKLKNEFIHDRLCNVIKSRNYTFIFCFFYTIETFSKKSMLYLKGLFTTDIYAPIIEQSQLACLTKSWRLKCKYSPSVGLLLTVDAVAATNWSQNFAKTFALN